MTGRPGDEGAISRRAALGVLGGAAAAVAAAVAGVRLVGDDDPPRDADSPAATEAPEGTAGERDDELDGIRRIGEAYLAARPEEASREALLEALDVGRTGGVDPEAEPEEILAGLEAAIREDFAEARVVVLDGWHLSVTEARVAALVALA